ncbi:MAG: saccharopine dehydrogenase NADP-binding domain-containing protein [Cytophagaceae bacterium]|nr:saccharopine dehydrogenase NADP-binding domain-containing protein [Cytophagaceae bacterium]
MKKILILGAGRSSSVLIQYLLQKGKEQNWMVTVGDTSLESARQKINNHPNGKAIIFDVHDQKIRETEIKEADLVISLLPPPFHPVVAQACLAFSKSLLTASYVSPEIQSMHDEAVKKNVLILMEVGLDPGIDHMSAMKELDEIKSKGGKLTSFKSYTGGLIAPESDTNPWHYKITWNPRNVVLAGKGTSKFLEHGKIKEVDYKKLFNTTEKISVKGYGDFEGYPNRDSLKYLDTYQLKDLSTFIRGTLRRPGYCSSWNILVQLGLTDENYKIQEAKITYKELIKMLNKDYEQKINSFAKEDLERVKWLGCLDERPIGISDVSPADVLQNLIEEKWKLAQGDKDMIVMQHQFEYEVKGKKKKLISSLVVRGDDEINTAMAKTVGLPLAISARLFLEGKIKLSGVQIPVMKEIYEPVLKELEEMGVRFENEEENL